MDAWSSTQLRSGRGATLKPIKIGLKGLAKFMTARHATQRKILRDYKYPDPEGVAQAAYYRDARNKIELFHLKNLGTGWLQTQASQLRTKAKLVSGRSRQRLDNNARTIDDYVKHFGKKQFSVLRETTFTYSSNGIIVNVTPDLHVTEKGTEKFIKCDFASGQIDKPQSTIVCQLMFEAIVGVQPTVSTSSVLLLHPATGTTLKGARVRARIKNDIDAACQAIAALWPTI